MVLSTGAFFNAAHEYFVMWWSSLDDHVIIPLFVVETMAKK